MSFWYLQFSKKMNERIRIYYYGTSSPIVFVHFLGELKIPKRHFEINWPLDSKELILWVHPAFSWRNDGWENSKSVAYLTPLSYEEAGSSLVSLHIRGEKRLLFAKILHTLSQPCAWPSSCHNQSGAWSLFSRLCSKKDIVQLVLYIYPWFRKKAISKLIWLC